MGNSPFTGILRVISGTPSGHEYQLFLSVRAQIFLRNSASSIDWFAFIGCILRAMQTSIMINEQGVTEKAFAPHHTTPPVTESLHTNLPWHLLQFSAKLE